MKVVDITEAELAAVENEVQIQKKLSTLSHPNIVNYKASYVDNISLEYSIIMEYCSGGSLADIIDHWIEIFLKNTRSRIS